MRRSLCFGMLLLIAAPGPAHAAFHEWEIQEVFSNATGSIQYIELVTTFDSQQFVSGHDITFTVGGTTNTFTFPGNSPSGTAGKTLLIATPGFTRIAGAVTPDFVLPCGPLFDPAASSVTINFVGADVLTITTPKVPVDGVNALVNGAVAAASPKNFAGAAGTMNLTACLNDGTCKACDDGLFCNGAEACSAGACSAAAACPLLCNETTDTCFQCDDAGDCNDGNVCTDDSCNGSGTCVRVDNTVTCNDGLFCTTIDTCGGGVCAGTAETCPGENCSEGGDFCGDCVGPADCADGAFCNGDEFCSAGACGAAAAGPCDLGIETCDEATDDCVAIVPPDAGVPDAELPDAEVEPSPDAGPTTPPDDTGCCSTTRRGPATGTLLLLAFVLRGLRRRAR